MEQPRRKINVLVFHNYISSQDDLAKRHNCSNQGHYSCAMAVQNKTRQTKDKAADKRQGSRQKTRQQTKDKAADKRQDKTRVRQDKTRQDKTRQDQDKTRQDKTRQKNKRQDTLL